MWYVWTTEEVKFCWANLRETEKLIDRVVDGVIKSTLKKSIGMVWTGFVCLRIGRGDGVL
jgi:hypothetical protein